MITNCVLFDTNRLPPRSRARLSQRWILPGLVPHGAPSSLAFPLPAGRHAPPSPRQPGAVSASPVSFWGPAEGNRDTSCSHPHAAPALAGISPERNGSEPRLPVGAAGGGSAVNPARAPLPGGGGGGGAGAGEQPGLGRLSTVPAPAPGKRAGFPRAACGSGPQPLPRGLPAPAPPPPRGRPGGRAGVGTAGVTEGVSGAVFLVLVSTWPPSQDLARGDLGPRQAFPLSPPPPPPPLRIPATALLGKAGAAKVLIVLMKMTNTSFPSGSAKGEAVGGAITHCGRE